MTALRAQSEIFFTIDEARILHKQQIRLVFCDSAKVILIDQLNTCKTQKSLLILSVANRQRDIQTLEDYNAKFQTEYNTLLRRNKILVKKNKLLKVGFIGGLSLGALVGFGAFLLK